MKAEKHHAQVVALAKDQWEKEGQVEIDANAVVSDGDDNGAYVQAWVWVDFDGTPLDKEKDPEEQHTLWIGHVNGKWGVWDNAPGFDGSNLIEPCNTQEQAMRRRDELESQQVKI